MNLVKQEKPRPLVDKREEDQLSRKVLIWLNTFPDIPDDVLVGNSMTPINFEFLSDNIPCMSLSTVPGAYITAYDILGGYDAEYQFKVIYRIVPASTTPDKRLKADELLDALGEWAKSQTPFIGENMTVTAIQPVTRAYLYDIYENGDEDHLILMKLTYHVSAEI